MKNIYRLVSINVLEEQIINNICDLQKHLKEKSPLTTKQTDLLVETFRLMESSEYFVSSFLSELERLEYKLEKQMEFYLV